MIETKFTTSAALHKPHNRRCQPAPVSPQLKPSSNQAPSPAGKKSPSYKEVKSRYLDHYHKINEQHKIIKRYTPTATQTPPTPAVSRKALIAATNIKLHKNTSPDPRCRSKTATPAKEESCTKKKRPSISPPTTEGEKKMNVYV